MKLDKKIFQYLVYFQTDILKIFYVINQIINDLNI